MQFILKLKEWKEVLKTGTKVFLFVLQDYHSPLQDHTSTIGIVLQNVT